MRRRSALLAAAAAGGLLAGGGTALWRSRDADGPGAEEALDPWSLEFEAVPAAPEPRRLTRGQPLLVNFWATWCVPCVTEMPLLDRFAARQSPTGWRVLALAVDQREPVRRFIAERSLQLPVALAGAAGLDLSRSLGNRHGGLPFTCAFDSTGRIVRRHTGELDQRILAEWSRGVN